MFETPTVGELREFLHLFEDDVPVALVGSKRGDAFPITGAVLTGLVRDEDGTVYENTDESRNDEATVILALYFDD